MRRSLMPASAARAMARKSRAKARGSPWKLPPEITSLGVGLVLDGLASLA